MYPSVSCILLFGGLILFIIPIVLSCPVQCICHREGRVDCSLRALTVVPSGLPTYARSVDLHGNELDVVLAHSFAGLTNLTSLDLSDNAIRTVDPDFFKKLPSLLSLSLRKNRLSQVPNGLPIGMERLDLRSNSISNISLSEVSQLARVRSVNLSRNLIAEWPRGTVQGLIRLERLDLASNLLRSLPPGIFSSLTSIASLRLSRNKIRSLARESFTGLAALNTIDLSRNHLKNIPSLSFNDLPSLRYLSLSRNEITRLEDGAFYGCTSLFHLNISHNNIQSVSEGWLFELTQLDSLDISNNKVVSFEPNVWAQSPNLRWLSLHRNRLHSLPSGAFRLLPFLEHLILSGNAIENLHKTAMTGLNNLNSLDLSSNTLAVCVEDGAVLYNTSMPFLKSLRFTNNQLTVIPTRAFDRFPALEELDLSDNPIATMLPGAFEPLQLKKLHLNSSSILCDCHVAWFSTWLFTSGVDRSTISTKCLYPTPLAGIHVEAIDVANLTCVDDSPRARVVLQPTPLIKTLIRGTARLACSGYGHGPIHIEWRVMESGKPRILSNDQTTIMNVNRTGTFNGTENGQELAVGELILLEVTLEDRAEYQCVVRNDFGVDYSQRAFLEVQQAPVFTSEPDDVSLLVGQNAKIICAATGVPSPVISWAKDRGTIFPAAHQRRLHVKPNDDHLYFMNVQLEDQGIYTCNATNDAGQIEVSATLRVFGNTFLSHLKDVSTTIGETLILDCMAGLLTGVQRMIWTKNGESLLTTSDRISLMANGQILVVAKAVQSDAGRYACELWAGNDLLARQSAQVDVQSTEQREIVRTVETQTSKYEKRIPRWVPISLAAVLIGFIITGLSWILIYWRRVMIAYPVYV